jgi:hypothetical protein
MIAVIRTMFRSLRTRLFAAALLLPLVAFATATGGYWLRCRVTGAALGSCCCGEEDRASATPPTTTVSEADCCDRVERHVAPNVAELTGAETAAPPAPVGVVLFHDPSEGSGGLVSAPALARLRARPSLGPPTARLRLVAKSTLLI